MPRALPTEEILTVPDTEADPQPSRGDDRADGPAPGSEADADTVELSVVVPCYFDADGMDSLFERLGPALAGLTNEGQIVIVDDGSTDGTTASAIQQSVAPGQRLTVVRLARNVGQHGAVMAGLRHADGDIVVTMDSDLQYDPDDIRLLIDGFEEGVLIVSGVREDRDDPIVRRWITAKLSRWISKRTGAKLRDAGSMFRAYRRPAIDLLLAHPERRPYLPMMAGYLGIPVKEVPVSHAPRGERGSRYRLSTLADLMFDILTGYAIAPLRVISLIGVAAAFLGFAASIALLLYRMIEGNGPSGLVTAFALVFFLFSVILTFLILLSETVGRMYVETRGHPRYIVADVSEKLG